MKTFEDSHSELIHLKKKKKTTTCEVIIVFIKKTTNMHSLSEQCFPHFIDRTVLNQVIFFCLCVIYCSKKRKKKKTNWEQINVLIKRLTVKELINLTVTVVVVVGGGGKRIVVSFRKNLI